MNNKPIQPEILAEYNIGQDFIDTLAAKLTNQEHLNCALRMFINGQLPLSTVNDNDAIDIPTIRKQIADAIRERRQAMAKHVAEYRRLDKAFYKRIKKAAFAEPQSMWKMDGRTIVNK